MPSRIRVGGEVQADKLINRPLPEYPPLALQARIQGVVRIRAVVSKDGVVGHLTLLSGHPLLVPAAFTAVNRYQYQSTTLNGVPVEVDTEIEVPFNLP
jgi:protein TonB